MIYTPENFILDHAAWTRAVIELNKDIPDEDRELQLKQFFQKRHPLSPDVADYRYKTSLKILELLSIHADSLVRLGLAQKAPGKLAYKFVKAALLSAHYWVVQVAGKTPTEADFLAKVEEILAEESKTP